jgi:two-component system KDP operon response regulator KdpE
VVLVIEDDAEARELLHLVLRGYGYDVVDATTGADGLGLAASRSPDLIVLDLGLPDMSGLDVIRELRTWSATPILVLSSSSRRSARSDALDTGADDYLAKPFFAAELAARLRAMARRGRGAQRGQEGAVRRFGRLVVDAERSLAMLDGAEVRLTPTEWRILEALTRHPGELVTHRWLVAQAWSSAHGRETLASLRTHLRSLRAKLGDDPAEPTYLRTESGVGYRWVAAAGETTAPAEEVTGRSTTGLGAQLDDVDRAVEVLADLASGLEEGALSGTDTALVLDRLDRLRDAVARATLQAAVAEAARPR